MNCFFNFQRSSPVPPRNLPAASQGVSETALRQDTSFRSGEQRTGMSKQARVAQAAYMSAKRHVPSAAQKLTHAQIGQPNILRSPFMYPSAVDVLRGLCQEEQPRQQTELQHSHSQQQALQSSQSIPHDQVYQPCQEVLSQSVLAKEGGRGQQHAVCPVAKAHNNDQGYVDQQLGSACARPSPQAQQVSSPSACGRFYSRYHPQQQSESVFSGYAPREVTPFTGRAKEQTKQQAVSWSNDPVSSQIPPNARSTCIISPRNPSPFENTFYLYKDPAAAPSCHRQPTRDAGANYATGRSPSVSRKPPLLVGGDSSCHAISVPENCAVPLHVSMSEAHGKKHCGRPGIAAVPYRNESFHSSKHDTTGRVRFVTEEEQGGLQGASGMMARASPLTSMERPRPGSTVGGKQSSVRTDSCPNQVGNGLFGFCRVSRTPQQQVGGTGQQHVWVQGMQDYTKRKHRAALFPLRGGNAGGGNFAHQFVFCGLHGRTPQDASLRQEPTVPSSMQGQSAAALVCGVADTQKRGSREEEAKRSLGAALRDMPENDRGKHQAEHRQNLATEHRSNVSDAPICTTLRKAEENVDMYSMNQSASTGAAVVPTPGQEATGFPMRRPRTPVRHAPEPHMTQSYLQSPRQPQPLHNQEKAKRYSAIYEQLRLQKQLCHLWDQHPYSWAATEGMPVVGYGSPLMLRRGNVGKQLPLAPHEQRVNASSCLPSAPVTRWQPRSPEFRQLDPASTHLSEGATMMCNQTSGTVPAESAACSRKHQQQRPSHSHNTVIKDLLQKRPTSAPPGQNDLRPYHIGAVVQSHTQRPPASSLAAATLANRIGIPWTNQYFPTYVLQHRKEPMTVSPLRAIPHQQLPPLRGASPLFSSLKPAFSSASRVVAPQAAGTTDAAAAVLTPEVARNFGSSHSERPAPAYVCEDSRQPSAPTGGTQDAGGGHANTAEQHHALCTAVAQSAETAPFLASAEERASITTNATSSVIRNASSPSGGKRYSNSEEVEHMPFHSGTLQKNEAEVPCDINSPLSGEPHLHVSTSAAGAPPCTTPEHDGPSKFFLHSNGVGVGGFSDMIHRDATPQQQQLQPRQHPRSVSIRYGDTVNVLTEGKQQTVQERQDYEAKQQVGRIEAVLSPKSAARVSVKQPRDYLLKKDQEGGTRLQQSLESSSKQHFVQEEQGGLSQEEQNYRTADQMDEQPTQRQNVQLDHVRVLSAVIEGSSGETRSLQTREHNKDWEEKDVLHLQKHARPQTNHVIPQERSEDANRSTFMQAAKQHVPEESCSANVIISSGKEAVTHYVTPSFRGPDVSDVNKRVMAADKTPLTPLENAYLSAVRSAARSGAIVGALAAALRCAASTDAPDCALTEQVVSPISKGWTSLEPAKTSPISKTDEERTSGKPGKNRVLLQKLSVCEHQASEAVPRKKAASLNEFSGTLSDPQVDVDATPHTDPPMLPRLDTSDKETRDDAISVGLEHCFKAGKPPSCQKTFSSHSSKYALSCSSPDCAPAAKLHEKGTDDVQEICESDSGIASASRESAKGRGSSGMVDCDTAHKGASRDVCTSDICTIREEETDEYKSTGNKVETPSVRARDRSVLVTSHCEISEPVGRDVKGSRMQSIVSSTDTSICTGYSTTTNSNPGSTEEDTFSETENDGREDVIPLPSFLWQSPLSFIKNDPRGRHSVHREAACTVSDVESLDRPTRRHNTEQGLESSLDKGKTYVLAATKEKNFRNNRIVSRCSSEGDGRGSRSSADMQLEDFELADPRFGGEASLLGRGTYGIVRLMRHKPTGRLYAVKSIEKSSVVEAGMVSQVEFELLTQKDVLRHRNVLRCHAFLEDIDRVHMILEYCSGGDLYTRIRTQPLRRISEQEAFLYFAQLVNGLHYMHTRCVMHRDLKLENLLLDKDGVLKIADLGWCTTILGKRRNFNFCGTLDYLAPEMIRGDGHDWRVDLWGAGILLYEMLDGKPPFQSTRHLELVQQILKAKINLPAHIPPDAGNLIQQLLQYDPEDRIPLHAICQHPWVKRMWNQLKRHYYKIYPEAVPAAFYLCAPISTARSQVAGTLSLPDGSKKRGLDLPEIYPIESAGTSKGEGVITDDGDDNKNRRPEKPHSLSTDNKQRHIIGVLQSIPSSNATLSNPSNGPAVATPAETHAGGGGEPDARPARWPTIGDGVTAVRKNLGETTKLSERAETTRRSASSPAKVIPGPISREERAVSRGSDTERKAPCSWNSNIHSTEVASHGAQHHHAEDLVHISFTCTESESSVHETLRQKPQIVTADPGLVEKMESADDIGIPISTHQRAGDGGPSGANEQQPVDYTESSQAGMVLHESINIHTTVAKRGTSEVVCDKPNTPGEATGSSTASVEIQEKSCISIRASSSTAAASPAPQDEEIALSAAASVGHVFPQMEDPLNTADDAPVRSTLASSSATRAVTPPVTRLTPRMKGGRSPPERETTSAPPCRRATAAAAPIEEILGVAPEEGEGFPLTSREAVNTCPRHITPGNIEEHCLSSVYSIPHTHIKPKRPGGPRRPKSSQPSSKIDSGLGSQKQILLAPPVKRSVLRACEPSDNSVSNEPKESEGSGVDTTTERMWTLVADGNSRDSSMHSAQADLHMPVPYKEMQPVTSLNMSPHLQHMPHLSRPMQQPQQLQQSGQQVQHPAAPSEKGAEYRICEPSHWAGQKEDASQEYQKNSTIQQQPLTRTGEAPYDSLQAHRQGSLYDQFYSGHQQQQPLLHSTSAGERDAPAAPSHQFSLEQHHMFPVRSDNSNCSSPERGPADLVHHSQRPQQRQQLAQQTEAQSVQQGASPVNYCQHQLAGNSQVPPKNRMVSSQPSSPWPNWYLPTPQQHMTEQQRQLYGQTPYVGRSEQQTSAKAAVLHGSPRHPLLGQQLQQQYTLSQQLPQQSLASMQQRFRQQQANPLYPPPNQQMQGQNQETPIVPFSIKAVPSATLPCRSMSRQECHNVANPVNLHRQSYGATFYAVGCKQPLRSMTPPVPSAAYRNENAANAAHIRSYQLLPHQQKMPLYPLMSSCMCDQVMHTEGRTDAFYKCMAKEEYPQCGGGAGVSQTCTTNISCAPPGVSEKPTAVSNVMGQSASTEAAGATIGSLPPTLVATGKDHALQSSADLKTCTGDADSHGLKPQSNYGHGDAAAGHKADSHAAVSTATSSADIASNGLTNSQGMCRSLESKGCIPYNALHAYTPRWGRGLQAVVDRSASVVPSSVFSPPSTTDLRSLLAVSAPPRSYATVARNQPSGLPLSGQSEQHPQQHRQQVQPTREHERSGMPMRSHQEQQRVPNQRAAAATVISGYSEAHLAAKEECRSQAGMTTRRQEKLINKQRLSCFSFGHTQQNSRRPSEENTNSTNLDLISDRLSVGSANGVGILSQRHHVPDANRSGHSPVVPSSRARLVLNQLFERSKLPRPTKTVGARVLPRTQGSRHRGGRSALASRTSAGSASVSGSRVSNGSSAMLSRRAVVGMPPNASNTSAPKTVCCRLRKGGSRSRLRAQSPPVCGDTTAAVAAAAAAWRARTVERDPRERKMLTTETSVKESKTVGGNLRQTVLRSGETIRSGAPEDSSLKKRRIREALVRSRIGQQGVAEGVPRKAETYSAAVPATVEGNCACPSDSPQGYAIAARLENRADENVSLTQSYPEKGDRGTALTLSPLGTPSIRDTPGLRKSREESNADPHANRSNKGRQTSPDHSDRLIASIAGYMSHRAERGDAGTAAVKSDNAKTNVSARLCMHSLTAPKGEKAQLQQQRELLSMTTSSSAKRSQSAESAVEQLNSTNTPNEKTVQPANFDVLDERYKSGGVSKLDAAYPYGMQPFQAGMQHCPQSIISRVQTLHSTSASPSKCPEHFSVLHKAQASNISTGLPVHPFGAAAAVATPKKPACARYWSPPTRDPAAVQLRSCSNGRMEGPFFSRQAPSQAMGSFSFCSPPVRVGNDEKRNQHQSTALHQINNYASTSGVPTSALTSSWPANQRQRYTTRQQTPPLGVANVASGGMRQATPVCLPLSGGQQQLYRALNSRRVPLLSVSSNIGGPPSTHDNTAGRKLDHLPSFSGFWGSAAIAGVSAAASTAACHAGLSRGHVHPGSGIRLLSFSSPG